MPETDPFEPEEASGPGVSRTTLGLLERTDTWAHVVVAVFFLLLALTVLVDTGIVFVKQLPLIYQNITAVGQAHTAQAPAASPPGATARDGGTHESGASTVETTPAVGQPSARSAEAPPGKSPSEAASAHSESTEASDTGHELLARRTADPFVYGSLELLSSILFAVIVLELLRTIITYLQTRNTQAIMKEFMIVGIISSVRKILLVGAESSMAHASGQEFVYEAIGTVITIGGILLLIVGLIILRRAYSVAPGSGKTGGMSSPAE